jgi:hypothetical protein
MQLRDQLDTALRRQCEESKQAMCVICLDHLSNIVCLPCKHLALCSYCARQPEVTDCPICRQKLEDKLQIYTP